MPDLIALSDVQTIAKLNANVEARKVDAAIADAHREVKKVLGKTGYTLVYANAPSFAAQGSNSAAYVTLLTTYIKPFMAWRAKQRAIVDMYAEPDKSGVYKKTGNDYEALGKGELQMVEGVYAGRANELLEDLLDHLEENEDVFTWFNETEEGEERIDKTNAKGVSGISFRRARGQDTYRG